MVEHRAALLSGIAAELAEHVAEVASDARVKGDAVIAAKDQVWIEADLHEIETGTVHVHVFAMLPPPAAAALEACIYGRAPSVEGAVAEAALVWARAAGAPILSVLAGRALDEADCFHGTEPWGVAGCHGFVGPILVRAGELVLVAVAT